MTGFLKRRGRVLTETGKMQCEDEDHPLQAKERDLEQILPEQDHILPTPGSRRLPSKTPGQEISVLEPPLRETLLWGPRKLIQVQTQTTDQVNHTQ